MKTLILAFSFMLSLMAGSTTASAQCMPGVYYSEQQYVPIRCLAPFFDFYGRCTQACETPVWTPSNCVPKPSCGYSGCHIIQVCRWSYQWQTFFNPVPPVLCLPHRF